MFASRAPLDYQTGVHAREADGAGYERTGGKPVGRRLCYDYEECLRMNAKLRGLPWPPVKQEVVTDAVQVGIVDDRDGRGAQEDGEDDNAVQILTEAMECTETDHEPIDVTQDENDPADHDVVEIVGAEYIDAEHDVVKMGGAEGLEKDEDVVEMVDEEDRSLGDA